MLAHESKAGADVIAFAEAFQLDQKDYNELTELYWVHGNKAVLASVHDVVCSRELSTDP